MPPKRSSGNPDTIFQRIFFSPMFWGGFLLLASLSIAISALVLVKQLNICQLKKGCNDGNVCTIDTCVDGICYHTLGANNCSTNRDCPGVQQCVDCVCQATPAVRLNGTTTQNVHLPTVFVWLVDSYDPFAMFDLIGGSNVTIPNEYPGIWHVDAQAKFCYVNNTSTLLKRSQNSEELLNEIDTNNEMAVIDVRDSSRESFIMKRVVDTNPGASLILNKNAVPYYTTSRVTLGYNTCTELNINIIVSASAGDKFDLQILPNLANITITGDFFSMFYVGS